MKRTPLKPRKKLLKRGKAPKRSPLVRRVVTRIKTKRKPKRFSKLRLPEYTDFIRGLPCLLRGRVQKAICVSKRFTDGATDATAEIQRLLAAAPKPHECVTPVEVAHVQSRGAGGKDEGNATPLCAEQHRRQHRLGIQTWATEWFGENGLAELRRIAAEVYPKQYEKAKALGFPE